MLELEFQRLFARGIRAGFHGEFRHVILEPVSGVAAGIQPLEAVGSLLQRLEAHAEVPAAEFGPAADEAVAAQAPVLAADQVELAAEARARTAGNRRRVHADRSGHGLRAVLDRRGTLADFDRAHALHAREVIRGGRGVGRRRDRHAVLEHRDLRVAVGARAADADVGADAEAFLLDQVEAGHLAQDAVHVGVRMLLEHGFVEVVHGAGGLAGLLARGGDDHAVEDRGFGQRRGFSGCGGGEDAADGSAQQPDVDGFHVQQALPGSACRHYK